MKKLIYVSFFGVLNLISFKGNCQYNLVPNPSFELFDTCPPGLGNLPNATYWTEAVTNVSPEFLHGCGNLWTGVPQNRMGYQHARTGLGYAGICNSIDNPSNPNQTYREYIQTELTDSLLSGVEYTISFYVSAGDSCGRHTNNFGAYFSKVKIDTVLNPISNLPFQPQFENPVTHDLSDRTGWTLVTGTFTANGGEKYLILGNFRTAQNSTFSSTGWGTVASNLKAAYLYIDDISVSPVDSITSIFESDSKADITLITSSNFDAFEIISKKQKIDSWELFNNIGQAINENKKLDDNYLYFNTENFSNGIYFIRLKMQNGSLEILKFLKI